MRLRIVRFIVGRFSDEIVCAYVIEFKKHWWSRWKIRDWDSRCTPVFYQSVEEVKKFL